MNNKIILFLIIILTSLFIFFICFFMFTNFTVKKVEIDRDFFLDDKKFYKYLNIKENSLIWDFDKKKIEEKLAKQSYLSFYKVIKKYPNTIRILLRLKKPIAKIVVQKGDVYFIDDKCSIFRKHKINYSIPLICYINEEKVTLNYKANDYIKKVIDSLVLLKNKNKNVYDGISQIDIIEHSNKNLEYIVNYRTINAKIYLKNYINVDLLERGLICALYIEENNLDVENVVYTGNGFIF
ncbi:MAG: hypothetical protein A2Z98_08570 [Spirochaetes bacterium GWB1_27_13]|nr:MAG: hypothetical protein A2Z98_08570 [Spirochaetes bacterium GWB1_27_13]